MTRWRCPFTIIILLQTAIVNSIVWNTSASKIGFTSFEVFTWHSGPIAIDATTLFCAPNSGARLLLPVNIARWILIFQLLLSFILRNGEIYLSSNFRHVHSCCTIRIVKSTRQQPNERIFFIVKLLPLVNAVDLLRLQVFQDVVVLVVWIVRFFKISCDECNRRIFTCSNTVSTKLIVSQNNRQFHIECQRLPTK